MPNPCHVLIVEDDAGVRDLFHTVLESEGFEVSLAGDGPSMREALAADLVDVVVLDVGLPGGESGLDLAGEAADCRRGVILITGYHEHQEALAASGHCHLLKPFRVEALLEAIERVVVATNAGCTATRRQRGS